MNTPVPMCTLYVAAYLYTYTCMYLSPRYTIVNSENYRNYSKCQLKRWNTTFPPFHASNRFEGKTNFAAFVGCTRRGETRRCGIANCGLLFFGLSLSLFAASFLRRLRGPKMLEALQIAFDARRRKREPTQVGPIRADLSAVLGREWEGARGGAGAGAVVLEWL